jgi:hypothetical protein
LQDSVKRVEVQVWEALHGSIFAEILLLFGASRYKVRMERTCYFLYLSQVVLIFTPGVSLGGMKQQISSEHFIDHTAKGPKIRGFIVTLAKNNLWRPVLSSLDLSRKVIVFPASVSQICYFYPEWSI